MNRRTALAAILWHRLKKSVRLRIFFEYKAGCVWKRVELLGRHPGLAAKHVRQRCMGRAMARVFGISQDVFQHALTERVVQYRANISPWQSVDGSNQVANLGFAVTISFQPTLPFPFEF